MAKLDHYQLLEVGYNACPEVVEAAYEVLVRRAKSEAQIKQFNIARDILVNPKDKAKYDRERTAQKGKLIGNYRVLDVIAEGGFGRTYKGEQAQLGTPVCIKHAHEVSPEDEEILLAEAKSIWDLRHYSIPSIRDIVKIDGSGVAIIMSYIPGPTLAEIVEKKGGLDPEHVAWITERILNVLKYLHFHGVVHGDIKPQNIIVQPESHTVVVVDYGLSLIRPTASTLNKGYTECYAPPEQMSGLTLLPESDFYSLGITMIQALGGDPSRRDVPGVTPDPMCSFIKRLIKHNLLDRPSWEKGDLYAEFQNMRVKAFGRAYSGMKKLVV